MMWKVETTTAYTDLKDIITLLAGDMPLPANLRGHSLSGNWKDYRDCYVRPDLALLYRCFNADAENPPRLVLVRIGSHSQPEI